VLISQENARWTTFKMRWLLLSWPKYSLLWTVHFKNTFHYTTLHYPTMNRVINTKTKRQLMTTRTSQTTGRGNGQPGWGTTQHIVEHGLGTSVVDNNRPTTAVGNCFPPEQTAVRRKQILLEPPRKQIRTSGLSRGPWSLSRWDRGLESRLRYGLSLSFCVVLPRT
jgi:hypothetical protein